MSGTFVATSVPLLDDWVADSRDLSQVSSWHSFLEVVDDHPEEKACWVCEREGYMARALNGVRFSDLMDHPVDVDACEDYWRVEGTI